MPTTPSPHATRAPVAAAPVVELWLKDSPPKTCTISKLSGDNLIFLSVVDEIERVDKPLSATQPVLLLVYWSQREFVAIRARVCHQTRERWVLDPMAGYRAELQKLRSRPAGTWAGPGSSRPRPTLRQRSEVMARYAQRVADYLDQRYPGFCNALDDALLRGAASSKADQASCLAAMRQLENLRQDLRTALTAAARKHVLSATLPGYLPANPDFAGIDATPQGRLAGAPPTLTAAQLARQSTATHEATLDRLALYFSQWVQRLTDPSALPGGPGWLCHYLATAMRSMPLPQPVQAMVYGAFNDHCLNEVHLLAQDLIAICEGRPLLNAQGTLPPAHDKTAAERFGAVARAPGHLFAALEEFQELSAAATPSSPSGPAALTPAELAEALAEALADDPDDPLDATTRPQPGGVGLSLCDRIARSLQSRGTGAGTWSDDQQRLLAITEALVDRIAGDSRTAVDARGLLLALKPALFRLVLLDPGLLTRKGHPALRAFNCVAHLCRREHFRAPLVNRDVSGLCQRIASEGCSNPRVFGALLPPLRELSERQQRLHERNLQRLGATLDGQHALDIASERVDETLRQRYGGRPFPPVLQALLDRGWHRLLVRVLLDGDQPHYAGPHPLALLQALYCQLLPEQAGTDWERAELNHDDLAASLLAPMDAYALNSAQFQHCVGRVLEALCQSPASMRSGDTYAIADTLDAPGDSGPGWHRRCAELQAGDWLGDLDTCCAGEGTIMQLAWKSPDARRFVFVNERGQTVGDWRQDELAARLRSGLGRVPAPGHWPALESTLYDLLCEAFESAARSFRGDDIAGLMSRDVFCARLRELTDDMAHSHLEHGLIGLHIKPMQQIARRHGEPATLALLAQCAAIVRTCCPDSAFVARGDGADLLVGLPFMEAAGLQATARQLQQALLGQPFCRGGRTYSLASRLGVTAVRPALAAAALIDEVVEATAQARAGKGESIVIAAVTQTPQHADGPAWLTALGRALEERRLALRSQAIVPLDGKRPRQHEILLGIIGDDGTVGAPGDLVAAAEQHQRMDIIDRWVIQHSLQWLRARAEPDGQAGLISINISANALCSDPFLDFLLAELDEGGFHHPHLRFEVTEATAAANLAQTVHFCDSVRSRGCQVALDEFGSRPSSLRILRYLPLDAIKIDGRAIAAMEHGRYHHAALAAIVAAARFLDLQTIAKSVECAEVLPVLKALGVDYAQGYGIAKPAPLDEAPPGDDDE